VQVHRQPVSTAVVVPDNGRGLCDSLRPYRERTSAFVDTHAFMVEQQFRLWASLAHDLALQRGVWRRSGSGGDGGAQVLGAIAEGGVLDLGDEDRRGVEGAWIAEVCVQ
jgi:hypothetical protein